MFTKKLFASLMLSLGLAACSIFPSDTRTGTSNVVMTTDMNRTTGHGALTENFEYGKKVFALFTLYPQDFSEYPKEVGAIWNSEGQQVTKKTHVLRERAAWPQYTPHYVWFWVNSEELGSGPGKVGIYVDNKLVKTASFTIGAPTGATAIISAPAVVPSNRGIAPPPFVADPIPATSIVRMPAAKKPAVVKVRRAVKK